MKSISQMARSHRLLTGIGAGVIALGGGVGIGIGISGASAPQTATSAPVTTSPSTLPAAKGKHKHPGVRGQITAENGTTWTVLTQSGRSVTVVISTSTKFGTKDHPATESQFVSGSTVAVRGVVTGTTVAATRIVTPRPKAGGTAGPVGSGLPTPSSTTAPTTNG